MTGAMLLCIVLFVPNLVLGDVPPSAPGDVAGAIGAASTKNSSSTLVEKSLARTELVRPSAHNPSQLVEHPSAHNPSQLVEQRPDSKDCTHVLFRMPKTGSTTLFNAAQEDDALHAHVCSVGQRNPKGIANQMSGHTMFPEENMTRPILVSVRRPEELWSSEVRYQGWKEDAVHELVGALPSLTSGEGRDLYGRWVLQRHGHGDIYLCIGVGMPEMHEQLRWAFGDERIRPLPRENVNHRTNVTSIAALAPAQQQRLLLALKPSFKVWLDRCGHLEPPSSGFFLREWLKGFQTTEL